MEVNIAGGQYYPDEDQMVLRMLVSPKYQNTFFIPKGLEWIEDEIKEIYELDTSITGIHNKWCYVTIRHGINHEPDNSWHFDGGSLRTELIPERDYVYVNKFGFEFKEGTIVFPKDFDPVKHNMSSAALNNIKDERTVIAKVNTWYLLSPFVFHRASPKGNGEYRTFIRITFTDIEIRDQTCTQNPLLYTEAYGRDSVKMFRNGLI